MSSLVKRKNKQNICYYVTYKDKYDKIKRR